MQTHFPALFVILGVLTGAADCGQPNKNQSPQQRQMLAAVSAPDRLAPPASLPEAALTVLRARMASHSHDMAELMSAIMVLQYPVIRDRAKAIANDVDLARPLTGDASELNAFLPDKFFAYQDELRKQAQSLSAAAEKADPFAVAEAYGRLSETCVKCHATYRKGN